MKRFVLVIDRDGASVSIPGGRRLAVWYGRRPRQHVGRRVEVFTPIPNWPDQTGATPKASA